MDKQNDRLTAQRLKLGMTMLPFLDAHLLQQNIT